MMPEPTVYVVDDDDGMRESLEWLISSVGLRARTFPSGQECLDQLGPDSPGCLVLDVRLRGMSGMELHRELRRRGIHLPAIMITGYAEVSGAVQAMKDGALDYIQKPFDEQALLDRIHSALARDAASREARARREAVLARMETLTPRERQVLDPVVEGKTNQEISDELHIKRKTVEVHRGNMMKKMRVSNVTELVRSVLLAREEQ